MHDTLSVAVYPFPFSYLAAVYLAFIFVAAYFKDDIIRRRGRYLLSMWFFVAYLLIPVWGNWFAIFEVTGWMRKPLSLEQLVVLYPQELAKGSLFLGLCTQLSLVLAILLGVTSVGRPTRSS